MQKEDKAVWLYVDRNEELETGESNMARDRCWEIHHRSQTRCARTFGSPNCEAAAFRICGMDAR